MASMDGPPTLEYWLEESIKNISPEEMEKIVEILEPYRETVENQLDGYDPEEHSWRDYRNSIWYCINKEDDDKVDKILGET